MEINTPYDPTSYDVPHRLARMFFVVQNKYPPDGLVLVRANTDQREVQWFKPGEDRPIMETIPLQLYTFPGMSFYLMAYVEDINMLIYAPLSVDFALSLKYVLESM